MVSREVRLGHLFVRLADSLVRDLDVVELLDELVARCTDLLDAESAALILADEQGVLRVLAASSAQAWSLEELELRQQDGPCLDCYHSGEPVVATVAADQPERWPVFAAALRRLRLGPTYALPLRLRGRTIGTLKLVAVPDHPLPDDQLQVAQALADVTTITILQQRANQASERLVAQLQVALNSRIAIEQAKGVTAQALGVSTDRAFTVLRDHARRSRESLTDVAQRIAAGHLSPEVLAEDR
ncbi:GAF and ANTAR domain-containing protein [Microlunatus parietis]|uniref:GAF domain-containing protein n=1 Tax=Microlunatus parietis TaxID=682979 RepID=A0A7Y9LFA7_9ACTN|nr:GAF and ANTAR domain-containing protein [Microlunatus parietis]NYE73921.1 GAF domain-containing protein [Microlunatus parietis]